MIGWVPPVIVGGVLRCWSLWFGLPNRFRPDEDMVVLPALGMVGGDLDPHDYTYPTLYKYLLVLVFRICMALGVGAEGYASAWQYAAYGFFVDSTFFFQVARAVTAILGIVTILAVYRIGCDAYNRWVGGVSAWLLAVSVLHVRDSHFGVTDVTSVAFLILGMVFIVRIAQQGNLRDYVWAGLLVGLGASTKYGSVLGLVPLGVAHLVQKPKCVPLMSRWIWGRSAWISVGICVLTFVVTSPHIVLNAEGFVRDFGFQMRHVYEYGHAADLGPGWLYHPQVTLNYGLGLLVLLFTVGGFVLACLQRGKADWVLLSLFVVFFVVTGRGRTVFFRYVLPLLPLCCLFAGVALDRLRQLSQGQYANVVGIALVALCVVQPLWASVRLDIMLGREDTRALAREWVEKEIPEGQIIANVGGLYGDVNIRNRHAISWWLPRFYWWFPEVPEPDLVDYLSRFESDLPPFFIYNHFIGNRDLDARAKGWLEILDNEDIAVVITHEHSLPYSQVNADFMAALEARADVWAVFEPGEGVQDAVFDLQDAFYYPMAKFGQMERGGPIV
ncbi:MAG: glycosyltransferase family 39 protein, partial [Candidatus Latescibacteria bacterium]|nr:glycosyltransferase family 39 protein [Candidatus Latescibacterota bacterium]